MFLGSKKYIIILYQIHIVALQIAKQTDKQTDILYRVASPLKKSSKYLKRREKKNVDYVNFF